MSKLTIRITAVPDGLEAKLVETGQFTEAVIDAVRGNAFFVMETVEDWIELSENLTTKRSM